MKIYFEHHYYKDKMRILGLIPARGGSKGIPRKNIKLLQGKALIEYSIETGLTCPLFDQVVISTEDEEIAAISKAAGAQVPFMRPKRLASDQSPTIDTVVHALRFFEEKEIQFDAVCLLQPTVPFRDLNDLSMAIRKFREQKADSLISVREVPHTYNPHWIYEERESGFLIGPGNNGAIISRRQDLPKVFHRDGSVYLTKTEVILEKNSLYGDKISYHIMEASPSVNIDTPEDWIKAETYAKDFKIS